MSYKVYTINKGVNRPLEFRGLKAQYVSWLAVGCLGLLLLFALLYLSGVPSYMCVGVVLSLGWWLFKTIYRLSKRHGRYGLMKQRAARRLPRVLVSSTRLVFSLKRGQ